MIEIAVRRLIFARIVIAVAVASAMFTSAAPAQIPCHYEITAIIQAPDCGIFPVPPTISTNISPNGQYVCGYYYQCGASSGFKAFVYKTQTQQFITLPFPSGMTTAEAWDVNDAGLAVGTYGGPPGEFGFVYDIAAGQYIAQLPSLNPAGTCAATAINNAGQVCGWRSIGSKGNPVSPRTGFIWTPAGFTDFGLVAGYDTYPSAVTEDGFVAGTVGPFSDAPRAFTWQAGELTVLTMPKGMIQGSVRDCTESHHICGAAIMQSGTGTVVVGHRWFGGQFSLLFPPGEEPICRARGLADIGIVVGDFGTTIDNFRGCVWRGSTTATDLNTLVASGSGVIIEHGIRVLESGVILANASAPGNFPIAVVLKPTPSTNGDINCDSTVNIDDILGVIHDWGPCPGCMTDVTSDGVVSLADLTVVIDHWTVK